MITGAEIVAGLTGAFRLMRRDPGGLACFDTSLPGFWKSFWAAALVAPSFLILDLLSGGLTTETSFHEIAIKMIGYVIDWTAFPVVMITVADSLDRWPNYRRYIVAYNWSAVVQMWVLLPVVIMAVVAPGHGTHLLAQFVTVVMLVYRAYVAFVALAVNPGTAAGIVLLDILLAALLQAVTNRLAGV
ncbi:MAG TPA: hypothetical protein VK196_09495 [Magnetospirillum sp.]|nr:hypothetical protein [Magnetospirillum sp.]